MKLREFQLKIIHKIYATDSYVSNFDGSVSQMCEKCQKKNNLFHWFAECVLVKQFWVRFSEWIHETFTVKIDLSREIVIFGYLENNEFEINYCILQVKWFIHKSWKLYNNMNKTHFSFETFLERLKYAIAIEQQIAERNNSIMCFNEHFSMLKTML